MIILSGYEPRLLIYTSIGITERRSTEFITLHQEFRKKIVTFSWVGECFPIIIQPRLQQEQHHHGSVGLSVVCASSRVVGSWSRPHHLIVHFQGYVWCGLPANVSDEAYRPVGWVIRA